MSMETAVLKACRHRAARREAVKRRCALRWYVEAGHPLDFRLNRNSDLEETSILRPSIAKFDVKFISERETPPRRLARNPQANKLCKRQTLQCRPRTSSRRRPPDQGRIAIVVAPHASLLFIDECARDLIERRHVLQ